MFGWPEPGVNIIPENYHESKNRCFEQKIVENVKNIEH